MTKKRRVLFLCTGNSARSQMAEGLVNHLWGDSWEAFSAGTKPTGYVHPLAIKAMAQVGIDISAKSSKPVEVYRGAEFDLVLTVCDNAAKDCPLWLGAGKVRHIGFADPAAAPGTDDERLDVICTTRDAIYNKLLECL
jgi:arsenate reductase